MEPEQHLAWRSAVNEDECGAGLCASLGDKKLAMDFQTIVTLECHLPRLNELV